MSELSGFAEIAATLAVAIAAIWLPGVIVIKAIDHIRARREHRRPESR